MKVDKDGTVASFSAKQNVDIYAPGVGIYSTMLNGNFGEMSGTSLAAPHYVGYLIYTNTY